MFLLSLDIVYAYIAESFQQAKTQIDLHFLPCRQAKNAPFIVS